MFVFVPLTSALHCTALHNRSNARACESTAQLFECEVTGRYSYIWLQGMKVIFELNSINCFVFVLARDPTSMLKIPNKTYQNIPRSSNYTF